MKFGTFPVEEAVGGILAHSLRLPDDSVLRKGLVLDEEIVDLLLAASISEAMIALPENGDVLEDEAAAIISAEFKGDFLRIDEARTGRVNVFSEKNGVFAVSKEVIDKTNSIDPGITVATLPDQMEVNAGRMVATIKIIPYAVSGEAIDKVKALDLAEAFSVLPYRKFRVGLISTLLHGTKETVLDKTRELLQRRISLSGSFIIEEKRVLHLSENVTEAIEYFKDRCDLLIIFGASAISDREDIIPTSIEESGGKVLRFGMPVDPGNLLLLAELNGIPVVGAPGCARGPAENGFDWVLQRLLAGAKPADIDLAGMGVGGLLMETGARPHPRLSKRKPGSKTAGIVLAAGQSRRMGSANKMNVEINGKPMVRHVVEAALSSKLSEVYIVTGYKPDEVKAALEGLKVQYLQNPRFGDGLSTSLSTGIMGLDGDFDSALVLLGDMPFVTAENIDALLSAQTPGAIVMATSEGKRGNPVLWPREYFEQLTQIEGDTGARHIIGANPDRLIEVELGTAAALDLDTPEAVQAAASD